MPPLSSNQNDLERPVVNSARPVFSDSMFIIPEQNFTGGDFKLLPPRTSAKMRRFSGFFYSMKKIVRLGKLSLHR